MLASLLYSFEPLRPFLDPGFESPILRRDEYWYSQVPLSSPNELSFAVDCASVQQVMFHLLSPLL